MFIILTLGILVGTQFENVISSDNMRENLRKFNDVLSFASKYYIEDVDTQKLVESAIKGMLEELDPHTVYIPPRRQEAVEEEFRGNFEGIGIEFQIFKDTITVVSPITGGPSEALGIMSGDRIVEIDGESSIGFNNSDVISRLRGEKGTEVDVIIYRPTTGRKLDFTIIRDKIPLYSVDVGLIFKDDIAYVSVSRFSETTTRELIDVLNKLSEEGMKKLVLDLRNNPGGLLSQAHQIADLFIDGKKMIVYTRGRRSEFDEDFLASRDYPYEDIPLVILINRGSASASEIVAGAIQDWDRGLIIGETSFGKGLVQRPFILSDNSAVRITISKYFTPSGRAIQREFSDKDNYYTEVHDRSESEGTNLDHETESDSTRPQFQTQGGRNVYGGGGITPDYIISSNKLSDLEADLRRANIYYQFIRKYLDHNRTHLQNKYNDDLRSFKLDFTFSDVDISEFVEFVKSNEIEMSDEDFERDRSYIETVLKAYIARDMWKNQGWYLILLEQDEQFRKAGNLVSSEANILMNR